MVLSWSVCGPYEEQTRASASLRFSKWCDLHAVDGTWCAYASRLGWRGKLRRLYLVAAYNYEGTSVPLFIFPQQQYLLCVYHLHQGVHGPCFWVTSVDLLSSSQIPHRDHYRYSQFAEMYLDEDGVATNQSQAVYDGRIRLLLFATCLLSFAGFGTSVSNGDYTRERLQFPTFLNISDLLEYCNLLWVSQEFLDWSNCWDIYILASHLAPQSRLELERQCCPYLCRWNTRFDNIYPVRRLQSSREILE